jgi:small GTP-binding protein
MSVLHAKMILLGQSTVGKSSLIKRYFEEQFSDNIPATFSSVFMTKIFDNDKTGGRLNMSVWDTCGQEKYMAIASLYYKDADIVLLIIDVDNEESLEKADRYMQDMHNVANRMPTVILVANKIDLLPNFRDSTPLNTDLYSKCLFYDKIIEFQREHFIDSIFWTSAKSDRDTVKKVFDYSAKLIMSGKIKVSFEQEEPGQKLTHDSFFITKDSKDTPSRRCC